MKMESFSKLLFKPDTMTRHQLKSILLNRTFLQSYEEGTITLKIMGVFSIAAYKRINFFFQKLKLAVLLRR